MKSGMEQKCSAAPGKSTMYRMEQICDFLLFVNFYA